LPLSFAALVRKAYSDGYACHGDVGLELEEFESHLIFIKEKLCGAGPLPPAQLIDLFRRLCAADLYLAVACAQGSDRAWQVFDARYRNYLHDVARHSGLPPYVAQSLAENVLGDLYMPDRSGRCRIASYDGRASLAAWLAVIVSRRAINERKRRSYLAAVPLPRGWDVADDSPSRRVEATIRFNRYRLAILDSYRAAIESLDERQRLIVALLYKDERSAKEVAAYLAVSPSTITYHTRQIWKQLRAGIISRLVNEHNLCPAAIDECLSEALENPQHSLLGFLNGFPAAIDG